MSKPCLHCELVEAFFAFQGKHHPNGISMDESLGNVLLALCEIAARSPSDRVHQASVNYVHERLDPMLREARALYLAAKSAARQLN